MLAYELYFGHKLNLKHLRVFGSIAYVHVPYEKRIQKLDAKSRKCIMVEYLREKEYKCYNPHIKQAGVSHDVLFDESASWYSLPSSTIDNSIPITKDEASGAEIIQEDEEEDIGTLEESLISFHSSGPNEELSRND